MRVPLPVPTSCTDPPCGVCCHGQEALPVGYWLSPMGDADPRWLPSAIRAHLVALRLHFDRHGWPGEGQDCVWYDPAARRCRHHAYRPSICIEFAVGGPECRHVRDVHRQELRRRLRA
jgi:Fe-S-cluster containining protein